MRAILFFRVFALACSLGVALASDHLVLRPDSSGLGGEWEIDLKKYQSQRRNGLSIEIRRSRGNEWHYLNPDRAPVMEKPKSGAAVNFVVPNDAGNLRLTGAIDGNVAEGRYIFEANRAFAEEAGKLLKRELTPEDLFNLSLADVTLDYLQEIQASGVATGLEGILLLRRHGVSSDAAKEFAEIGFKKADDIVRLRNHGVSPDYARKTRALKYGAEADELVKLRNHGASPEYLGDWKEAGFAPTGEEAIRLRNHGLQASYAAAWKKAGFDFTYDELIRARNHGVPSEFAAALKLSEERPELDDLIRLRNSGVNAEYYRELKTLNPKYTSEEIVRLRQHGVPADYIQALQSARADFSAEDIVKLRNNGVKADFVAALNVPGRKPLDLASIIELRNRGVSVETARKLRE